MPANLPAEARAKWIKVMEARTIEERIRAMEEFLSAVPKHKGTEKLVKQVKRRLAELKRELEERKAKERAIRGASSSRIYFSKDGDAQMVVVGPPLSGKSALMRCLTNANVEPDETPYSVVEPVPGMFVEGGVYFQLIRSPSLVLENFSSSLNIVTLSLARNADGILVVLDATDDPLEKFERIRAFFEEYGISITRPKSFVKIVRRGSGGIQLIGKLMDGTYGDVRRLLKDYGIHHATIYIHGEAKLEDVEDAIFGEVLYRPAIVILSKVDMAPPLDLSRLSIPYIPAILNECKLDRTKLASTMLGELGLIRVYTKQIHSNEYSSRPLVVKKGSTVGDIAKMVHSTLYDNFKYAVVWSAKEYPNNFKRVGINYVLDDGDIVEIHA